MSHPSSAPARASSQTLVRLALAAIVTNVVIVVTGGIVRVTGSGLGCPDWPACEGERVVPAPGAEAGWHQAVEFGNRLLSFVVLAVVVSLLVVAWRERPRRRQIVRPAVALTAGVVGQAILGGITVLTDLNPLVVAAHFLVSMGLIAIAVVLHERVRNGVPARPRRHGSRVALLAGTVVAIAAVVLVLGTLVTASGPHAGDPGTPRLGLDIRTMARIHSAAVWTVVVFTVATVMEASRAGARRAQRAAWGLLVIEVMQGAVGYIQYLLGIPAELVTIHLLLASLFWVAAVHLLLVARAPVRSPRRGARAPVAV